MLSFPSLPIAVLFATPLSALAVITGVAAVPIIIHLLNRKRYQIVPWAAMRFLLAAQKKNVRRVRLEQLLLLLVRVLIGVLIVGAMIAIMPWLKPVWQKILPGDATYGSRHGRTHHIIVIDAAYSMGMKVDGDVDRFEKAKESAKAVVERAAAGDGFSVILLTSPAQVIVGGPADNRDKVVHEIDKLRLPHGNADSIGGLRMVADLVNQPLDKYVRREVTIITEFKRSSWPAFVANRAAEAGAPAAPAAAADSWHAIVKGAQVAVIDVAREDVDNLAVTNLVLGDPLPLVGITNSVTATLVNHGKQARKRVHVELRIAAARKPGEKLIYRDAGQEFVDLLPGASVSVTFPLKEQNRFREAGDYILQVKAGEDALPLDDVRSLAVSVRETIPVLVVNGKVSSEPLDTPGEWVRRALRPSGSVSPASPTIIDPAKFANPFQADLTKYDCVFLCDLPDIKWNEVERLEAHLRRGGSIVIGLGPNAAQNLNLYNERLFNEGKGILPGKLRGVRRAEGKDWFSLFADQEEFKHPPLAAYREEEERAALTSPQFHQYVRIDAPINGPARRIFSFQPMSPTDKAEPRIGGIAGLDAAVIDYPRHRGHVIIYTSTFNPERIARDQHWSSWPPHPTFLPFWHETLRYIVASGSRRNLLAGDPLSEYLPLSYSGLTARLIHCDGNVENEVESASVISRDEAAIATFAATERSGVYCVSVGTNPEALFAINVPVTAVGGGAEGDLRRVTLAELQTSALEADFLFNLESGEIRSRDVSRAAGDAADSLDQQDSRGPAVAHVLLLAALVLMFVEVVLAWYLGSARATNNLPTAPSSRQRLLAFLIWLLPTLAAIAILAAVIHAFISDRFLSFLPSGWRQAMESSLGVQSAPAGESTEWRLNATPYVTGRWSVDRWLVGVLVLAAIAFVWSIYARERTGIPGAVRGRVWRDPRLRLAILRTLLFLLTLLVLLPQLSIVFERKGWPDIVLIFDDSRSMAAEEPFTDPVLRDKTDELKTAWDKLAAPRIQAAEQRIAEIRSALQLQPSGPQANELRDELAKLEKKVRNLRAHHRLNLIKALLASGSQDWLQTLVREKQMRVHIYRVGEHSTPLAKLSNPDQCARMLEEIIDLEPEGESSPLGDVVATVLKTFRGRSLSAVVMFTDGQTTKGEDLPKAAAVAASMKVPLFFVGVGDNQPAPDLVVGDLKAERVINVKDRLIFEVRVTAEGNGMPDSVPVSLIEIVDGKRIERDKRIVQPSGKPVRLSHVPDTHGDKKYVVETPVVERETNPKNNRVEHDVYVAEMKRVRVLFIENKPRYEYRFVKTLFERESEQVAGNKSIELSVLQLGAARDAYKQDKSAIAEFPPWDVLRTYDVVILGDFDLKQLPREQTQIKMLVDFVKERGGGLLVMAGEQFSPHAFANTDLADILPIATDGISAPAAPRLTDPALTEPYRARLTSLGVNHPIFRFVADEARNAEIWGNLAPMFWYSKAYRRKLSAEVLAVHPTQMAESGPGIARDELHPLVLQQFVGAGRVMFFGFDETWRWRQRLDESRFNQFWIQTVRSLARARVGRIELSVERKIYRRDEPIRIAVRFPEDAPPPNLKDPVQVDVERRPLPVPGKKGVDEELVVQTIQLSLREGTRATFEALLPRTPEGEYRFVLKLPDVPGVKPYAEATVLPPVGELDNVRLNEPHLIQAARLSRKLPFQIERDLPGELEKDESKAQGYYPLDKAGGLLDDLPERPRVVLDQPCQPIPLWNHWLTFAAVFGLLFAEWVLRKRARLL
jgi:Aerotolerance regulator N-terminal/von Willebrand factor type A domain